jgi:hypothetical protein
MLSEQDVYAWAQTTAVLIRGAKESAIDREALAEETARQAM